METKTQSQQFLRKRKFLMVLPIMVLPFLTLLFWVLGGGAARDVQGQQRVFKHGLNMELPDANFKDDKPLDKLSYYEKAALDSSRLEELIKNDPYYLQKTRAEDQSIFINDSIPSNNTSKKKSPSGSSNLNTSPYGSHSPQDPNEAKVYNKLEQLNSAINQSLNPTSSLSTNSRRVASTSMNSSDIDRLEQMMKLNRQDDGSEDPEMKQLNGMMEKILDIQHPERFKDKIKQTSEDNKGQVFAFDVKATNDFNSLLVNNKSSSAVKLSNIQFYSLNDEINDNNVLENTISASIHQSQVVVNGSIVKLRLLTDVFINGKLVPKNNFVFGTASLNGERLLIKITSIRYNNSIYPVDLSVFDLDGIAGIYIPGAITRDVAKQSADRAIQGIGLTTVESSLKVQAASAGVEAAKTLFSKKAKLIKVLVKAGYQVLLQDDKQTPSF